MKNDNTYIDDLFAIVGSNDPMERIALAQVYMTNNRDRLMRGGTQVYWIERGLAFLAGLIWTFGVVAAFLHSTP